MALAVSIEDICKRYRLGALGAGSAAEDVQRWFNRAILRKTQDDAPIIPLGHNNIEGDTLWALRNVSFEVEEGEVLGIIGRNGAGKSTLLKIMSRITAPTSGCIRIRGRLVSLLEVGTGFSGELTGRENIYLNGGILGMKPREVTRRLDEIIDFAEIEDFIDTPVKRYSSGMFVRLAFAVAAHLETDIMIIDEVLAVGDIGFQKKCLGKMSSSARSGRTILFVSHRMDHITALCPRSIVLSSGRMIFDGPTPEATQRYYGLFENQKGRYIERTLDKSWRGRVRITGAWLENELGQIVTIVASGAYFRFVIALENQTPQPVTNLKVSVFLYTQDGTHLADLGIWESGTEPFSVDRLAQVWVEIPRPPLNRGQYRYSVVVRSAGGAYEIDDMVENVADFNVDFGDYHGIGSAVGGVVSIDHKVVVMPKDEE